MYVRRRFGIFPLESSNVDQHVAGKLSSGSGMPIHSRFVLAARFIDVLAEKYSRRQPVLLLWRIRIRDLDLRGGVQFLKPRFDARWKHVRRLRMLLRRSVQSVRRIHRGMRPKRRTLRHLRTGMLPVWSPRVRKQTRPSMLELLPQLDVQLHLHRVQHRLFNLVVAGLERIDGTSRRLRVYVRRFSLESSSFPQQ